MRLEISFHSEHISEPLLRDEQKMLESLMVNHLEVDKVLEPCRTRWMFYEGGISHGLVLIGSTGQVLDALRKIKGRKPDMKIIDFIVEQIRTSKYTEKTVNRHVVRDYFDYAQQRNQE